MKRIFFVLAILFILAFSGCARFEDRKAAEKLCFGSAETKIYKCERNSEVFYRYPGSITATATVYYDSDGNMYAVCSPLSYPSGTPSDCDKKMGGIVCDTNKSICQILSTKKCAEYTTINGQKTQYCATCGDGICESTEGCIPSTTDCKMNTETGRLECMKTDDCGALYCPQDCK